MSKSKKLFEKLRRIPSPTDFRWEDFVSIMERAGFTVACTGGSHHTFEHESGFCFGASKTHPSGVLKKYQIQDALEALAKVGYTGDE